MFRYFLRGVGGAGAALRLPEVVRLVGRGGILRTGMSDLSVRKIPRWPTKREGTRCPWRVVAGRMSVGRG